MFPADGAFDPGVAVEIPLGFRLSSNVFQNRSPSFPCASQFKQNANNSLK
jgi:hypothetical protein